MRDIAFEAFKEKSDKADGNGDVGGTHIGIHRDLAEFQYDIRNNAVFFRRLDGWWPEALRNAGEFRHLKVKEVARGRPKSPVRAENRSWYIRISDFCAQ